jgi:hypothetical protein
MRPLSNKKSDEVRLFFKNQRLKFNEIIKTDQKIFMNPDKLS